VQGQHWKATLISLLREDYRQPSYEFMLTVNFRQPSHEFTINVGIDLLFSQLELTPRI
jgi:hypothetical protein